MRTSHPTLTTATAALFLLLGLPACQGVHGWFPGTEGAPSGPLGAPSTTFGQQQQSPQRVSPSPSPSASTSPACALAEGPDPVIAATGVPALDAPCTQILVTVPTLATLNPEVDRLKALRTGNPTLFFSEARNFYADAIDRSAADAFAAKVSAMSAGPVYLASFKASFAYAYDPGRHGLALKTTDARNFAAMVAGLNDPMGTLAAHARAFNYSLNCAHGGAANADQARAFADRAVQQPKPLAAINAYIWAYTVASSPREEAGMGYADADARAFATAQSCLK